MKYYRIGLWVCVIALCGIGLIMLLSNTTSMNGANGDNYSYTIKQLAALCIGVMAALGISRLGPKRLQTTWFVLGSAAVSLGLLLIVPYVGRMTNGATRWIDVGPIKVQPAELAKITLIILAAWYFARVGEKIRQHWNGVVIPLLCFAVYALLIYRTRDLGSVIVLTGILWAIFVFVRAPWMYVTGVGVLAAPLVAYVAIFQEAFRRERMGVFLNPFESEANAAYHLQQSLISIGNGRVTGVGLGQGLKDYHLPELHTDFIYCIICEEFGMIGGVIVAALFFLLVTFGFHIANSATDRFQRVLAIGATLLIGIQAFWNMYVVTSLVPTKGLTLPFISYGGTSLVVCLVAVGLLDSVARHVRSENPLQTRSNIRVGAVTTKIRRRRMTKGG